MNTPSQILSINIATKALLQTSYLPYMVRGGIMIPANKSYALGEEVLLTISLVWDDSKVSVAGHVAIVTPNPGAKTSWIGIHFADNAGGREARNKLEALLN